MYYRQIGSHFPLDVAFDLDLEVKVTVDHGGLYWLVAQYWAMLGI
jgi:hypothetical protein